MVQTYPVDNLLFILKCALEENSNLKQGFLNMEGISDIVDYLVSDNYNEAKYQWLSLCNPFIKITRNQWNAEGTDKNLGTIPLKQYLKRRYTDTCTSERYPSRQNYVNIGYTSEVCLHMPESKVKMQGSELISLVISVWSTGGRGIACK